MNITPIDITTHVNTYYRSYALYVIESRGIPNFYDSLTPVQRLILMHAPDRFEKTIGLVGSVFNTGLYHHGDASLASAINKLARPFACAEQVMVGDGFFGSPVTPQPASPRYTRVKISAPVKEHISRYSPLNQANSEGVYDWIHLDFPIGLMTHIVGIAVGYASNILPRKPSDVEEYLQGKPKQLKPYFRNFDGKISKHKEVSSGWLIEGEIEVDEKKMTIHVKSLPPLMRYESFMNKLRQKIVEFGDSGKIENNSKIETDLFIKWRDQNNWEMFRDAVVKNTKMVVVESLTFVKDGVVVEYDTLTDYLDEFRVHREAVIYKKMNFDLSVMNDELDFLRAKLAFLKFMMVRKRKNEEVREWMKPYSPKIRARLDAIKLTALTEETVRETEDAIQAILDEIKEQKKAVAVQLVKAKELEKLHRGKGRSISINKPDPLFSEEIPDHLGGVEVFVPELDTDFEDDPESEDAEEN